MSNQWTSLSSVNKKLRLQRQVLAHGQGSEIGWNEDLTYVHRLRTAGVNLSRRLNAPLTHYRIRDPARLLSRSDERTPGIRLHVCLRALPLDARWEWIDRGPQGPLQYCRSARRGKAHGRWTSLLAPPNVRARASVDAWSTSACIIASVPRKIDISFDHMM